MAGIEMYKKVEVESRVNSASRYEVVFMFYEASLKELRSMRESMVDLATMTGEDRARNIEARHAHSTKVIQLISGGLMPMLNLSDENEISEKLFNLYEYVTREVVSASAKNSLTKLDSCIEVMEGLQSAWVSLGEKVEQVTE